MIGIMLVCQPSTQLYGKAIFQGTKKKIVQV